MGLGKSGEISQLAVYGGIVERLSNDGDVDGFRHYSKLILSIASDKRRSTENERNKIVLDNDSLNDEKLERVEFLEGEMKTYDGWLDLHSPDSVVYQNRMQTARANSWKMGEYSIDTDSLGLDGLDFAFS